MRIFCLSWPKAGTHLLLDLAKSILPEGPWFKEKDIKYTREGDDLFFQQVSERISRYGDNFAIKGHIPWSESIESFLVENNFKILFIVRDPRDVICSTYRWLTDLRKEWAISKYLSKFPPEIQLAHIIKGMPALFPFDNDAGVTWNAPLPQRYAALTPWVHSDAAIPTFYEGLSGNSGHQVQLEEVEKILAYLGLQEDAVRVAKTLHNPGSETFHSGQTGTWGNYFSQYHRKLFVDLGGDELVEQFGYRKTDLDTGIELFDKKMASPHIQAKPNPAPPNKAPAQRRSFLARKIDRIYLNVKKLLSSGTPEKSTEPLPSPTAQPENLIAEHKWLLENREERMDATVEIFPAARREFHLARYQFASAFSPGKTVVDIACGTGYGTEILATEGLARKAFGVDISGDAISYAGKAHKQDNIEFVCASADKTPLPDATADFVASFETIEHVPSDTALLEEVHRILKPGGLFICSTPNDWPLENAPFHVRTYTRRQFEDVLSNHFELVKLYNQNPPDAVILANSFRRPGIYETTDENQAAAEVLIAVCRKREK